jgi:hypothetical protein
MTDSQQPTVVLVHGAFADSSGFSGIFSELTASGYDVVAPPNPLRSLAFDAAAIRAAVQAIDGPVPLVGHYPTPYDAPGAPQGPDLYIKKEPFRDTFCADLPVDVAEFMAAAQRPLSLAAFTEKCTAVG